MTKIVQICTFTKRKDDESTCEIILALGDDGRLYRCDYDVISYFSSNDCWGLLPGLPDEELLRHMRGDDDHGCA